MTQTVEQQLTKALRKAARRQKQIEDRTAILNEDIDEIKTLMDDAAVLDPDAFATEYGTIERIVQPKKAGNKFDRATFETEFPEVDADVFGITLCNDPHACKIKPWADVEAALDALEGYTQEQKDRMCVLLDIRTMPDRMVVHVRTPGNPPVDWPEDEEEE